MTTISRSAVTAEDEDIDNLQALDEFKMNELHNLSNKLDFYRDFIQLMIQRKLIQEQKQKELKRIQSQLQGLGQKYPFINQMK